MRYSDLPHEEQRAVSAIIASFLAGVALECGVLRLVYELAIDEYLLGITIPTHPEIDAYLRSIDKAIVIAYASLENERPGFVRRAIVAKIQNNPCFAPTVYMEEDRPKASVPSVVLEELDSPQNLRRFIQINFEP